MSARARVREAWQLRDRPSSSARECIRRGLQLTGPRGVIHRVAQHCRRPDMIDLVMCDAVATSWWNDHRKVREQRPAMGAGAGLRWEVACAAAIGEVIERACARRFDPSTFHVARQSQLPAPSIDLTSFALFSATQYETSGFPFVGFDASEQIPWSLGYSYTREEPIFVPAEMTYLCGSISDVKHHVPSSNGVAAATSLEEALCAAFYEIVERDAVMITWMTKRPTSTVDPGSFCDSEVDELIRRIAIARGRLHLRDITTDVGVPTYLGIVEGQEGGAPSVAIGAAARLEPVRAARKAITEAMHTWNWATDMSASMRELEPRERLSDVTLSDFSDHVWLYAHRWTRPRLEFLLSGHQVPNGRASEPHLDTPRLEVEEIVRRLQAVVGEVAAIDLTPPEVSARGFRVVRALVPELIPLAPPGHHPYRGSRRYYDVPERLGNLHAPRVESDLNQDPHPFP